MLQDDRSLMPPPSVIYKRGTPQFQQALKLGAIQLSAPPSQLSSAVEQTLCSNPNYPAEKVHDILREYPASTSLFLDSSSPGEDSRQTTESPQSVSEFPVDIHCSSSSASSPLMRNDDNQAPNFYITQSQDEQPSFYGQENSPAQVTVSVDPSSSSTTSIRKRKVCSMGDGSSLPLMETTRFKNIIGHSAAKAKCDELLLPMWLPPTVTNSVLTGVRSMPASILLFGPPGCGKTQMARALAGEAQAAFFPVAPSDVYSKFVGVCINNVESTRSNP